MMYVLRHHSARSNYFCSVRERGREKKKYIIPFICLDLYVNLTEHYLVAKNTLVYVYKYIIKVVEKDRNTEW